MKTPTGHLAVTSLASITMHGELHRAFLEMHVDQAIGLRPYSTAGLLVVSVA